MIYRKLYVDGCVEVVCNALEIQGPLTLEQLCQTIQEKLPGSCVPKDNLKEDARLVILDDSSFTIEYANTVPETKLLFSIAHELGHLILHFLEDDGNGKLKTKESVNIGEVEEYEANEFAAYLLKPDEQFISKCKEFSENGMISINKLAEYFHVSNRTATVRGMALGLW
ncbi:ImmA/IrrE family metallo-endopeptidase [Anaerobutyricum hallii]|uniref:ImmA/IrrE family metallo-endopeptidase n=1 Tax=Anaerobutyricum hallii TaxID=39488 RepID=UPI001ADD9C3A|nr:ImmA/IrrE family metallo-endopeptidase [Anaerobutyricum hallii]MBP0066236.1 ImmA/IrrE family metallo-endopeptidase [Anaerobutyricum hallii]